MEADIKAPHLEIIPKEIIMKPNCSEISLLTVDGLREFVRLKNPLNVAVSFEWIKTNPQREFNIYPEAG